MALKFAKELYINFKIPSLVYNRNKISQIISNLRREIFRIRKVDIDSSSIAGEILPMPNFWYKQLVQDMCKPENPKARIFRKYLITEWSQICGQN